uniref:Kinetochore protein NDC80 n=1 Tax=Acanthochromis polyacanthus TaxID=80966 RepID=A0A3Q1GQD2_9TELE
IPKPQSGTSETRSSFFGARTSGASMLRNSTMSGFGGTEKIKDTRPLHDKSFVQQCIRQLQEFLTEQGYPGTLSSKTLQSPSTKEFVKMFEFIYQQLDPTFEMPKSKVEEEIPALLKALRYPFVLSKSSMYSVGAPHTWPQALAALIWLIDSVKIYRNLSRQDLLSSDFCKDGGSMEEGAEYNKLFLDHTAETYSKFMQGQDTFEEEDEFLNNLPSPPGQDRLMSKRMEKDKLQADLKKLQSYRSSLETFQASLEKKASELEDELDTTVSHLETLKHERNEVQHLLQKQKFTPADLERITREKRELQQTISSLSKSLEDAEQHKWNEEMAFAKVKEKAELKLAEYHKLARKLKLIPPLAENACCHDFEIRPSECGPGSMVQQKTQVLTSVLYTFCAWSDWCSVFQMLLRKLISDVEEENSQLTNAKLSLEEYHLVLQETNEERRTVANNLVSVFSTAADHLSITEKSLEDLHRKVQQICSKSVEEDKAAVQKMQEAFKSFKSKASGL